MATYTVTEVSLDANVTETGDREYLRVFVVQVSEAVSSLDVLQGGQVASPVSLPRFGQTMTTTAGTPDGSAVCVGLRVAPNPNSVYFWTVEARYSSRIASVSGTAAAGAAGPGGVGPVSGNGPATPESPQAGGAAGGAADTGTPTLIENPLLRPAQWSWGSTSVTGVMEFDVDGIPVLNAAGYPFDPPVEEEITHPILTVTKNLPIATITSAFIETWKNRVNSVAWMGFPAKSLRLKDITASMQNENGVWFWAATFVFERNPDLWIPTKILNAGWYDLDGKEIRTNMGTPPARPPLLDADGYELAVGEDPTYIEITRYLTADFANLGLF